MSKISRKTSLALAVAGALVFSLPAFAAAAPTHLDGTEALANVTVKDATTPVNLPTLTVNVLDTDLIIGRTTGFSVRIDLIGGAVFNTAVATNPAVGAALPGGGWTATAAAGGQVGDSFVVYSVQPGVGSTGVVNGPALTLAGYVVKGAAGLATAGGSVQAKVTFADPNTAQPILTPYTATVVSSVSPLQYTVTPAIAGNDNGAEKIDVGTANGPSKTTFALDGVVNSANGVDYFNAGTLAIAGTPKLNAGATDIIDAATGVQFDWTGASAVGLTVTGTFSAFSQTGAAVFLSASATCASQDVAGTLNAAGTSATFTTTTGALAADPNLCFAVPATNATAIDATAVNTTAVATWAATSATASGNGAALPMAYNGPVAVVYTFNPASNTNQQSMLRVSNTGGAGGQVSITATDDAGNSAGPVTFNLGAGKSVYLSSGDLENGNAGKGLTGSLGTGTGKWILTVTGEIPSMEVTNLNRNNSSGTLNNLGTPVSGDYQ